MPLGYQITQRFYPLIRNIKVFISQFKINNGNKETIILIRKLCLEHDSSKVSKNKKYINCLRSGNGLMEIVTEPCFGTAKEVKAFIVRITIIFNEY